jgi:hypothetical protein
MCKKSDKIAEAWVPLLNLLLPNVSVVRNLHAKFGRVVGKRPRSSAVKQNEKKIMKLVDLKKENVDISNLV